MKQSLKKLLKNNLPFSKKRNFVTREVVIVHNHLFKNAGTSIDWALDKNFGAGFVDHREDILMLQGASYLGPYIERNKQICAISTHHLTLPLPSVYNIKLIQLLMFRHPIERVTSVYNYEKKQLTSKTPGAVHARKLSLLDYIHWRMKPEVGNTIRNFHVSRCINKRVQPLKAISETELQEAVDALPNIELLGVVERFDESMVLFEDVLQQYFPNIDLSYKKQNINQDQHVSQDRRIRDLRDEIGDETYNFLIENNKKDLILHDEVLKEFESRVSSIADMEDKLSEFRQRCLNL